jgi:alkylhydroperoxidase/carboxymuconolactone decarboxylase family protein YurZ
MDNLTRELISIGASAGVDWPLALADHAEKAKAAGANEEQIAGAVEVGKAIRSAAEVTGVAIPLGLRACCR